MGGCPMQQGAGRGGHLGRSEPFTEELGFVDTPNALTRRMACDDATSQQDDVTHHPAHRGLAVWLASHLGRLVSCSAIRLVK